MNKPIYLAYIETASGERLYTTNAHGTQFDDGSGKCAHDFGSRDAVAALHHPILGDFKCAKFI